MTATKKTVLPPERESAVRRMIDITRDMRVIVEKESAALDAADGDALKLAIDQKADLAFMYEDAAREFHQRREEFRDLSPALLNELDKEQKILKATETENRNFYNKAQGKLSS